MLRTRGFAYARYFTVPGFGAAGPPCCVDVEVNPENTARARHGVWVAMTCRQMVNHDGVSTRSRQHHLILASGWLKVAPPSTAVASPNGAYDPQLPRTAGRRTAARPLTAPRWALGESASVPSAAMRINAIFDATGALAATGAVRRNTLLAALRSARGLITSFPQGAAPRLDELTFG